MQIAKSLRYKSIFMQQWFECDMVMLFQQFRLHAERFIAVSLHLCKYSSFEIADYNISLNDAFKCISKRISHSIEIFKQMHMFRITCNICTQCVLQLFWIWSNTYHNQMFSFICKIFFFKWNFSLSLNVTHLFLQRL